MTLKEKITADMKDAMRARDSQRLDAIRLLLAALKQREVDERIVLDDAQIVSILEKLLKQRRDSIQAFEAAARHDLADKEKAEIAVLSVYLPARLSEADIAQQLQTLLAPLGTLSAADMGRVMALAKSHFAGKADMAMVSALVKKALA